MTAVGIDISNNNTMPDVTHYDFVIHKVSEGGSFVDGYYANRHNFVSSQGKLWGGYHFFRPGVSADAQLALFLSNANLSPGDFVALDFEDDGTWGNYNAGQLASMADAFMRGLTSRIPQHRAVLYCNRSTYAGIIQPHGVSVGDGLWIASPGVQPQMAWVLWQYGTDVVDQDYGNFAGFTDMQTWATTAGQAPPAPPIPPTQTFVELEAMPLGEWPAGGNQEHIICWPVGPDNSHISNGAALSMVTGGANAIVHGHIYAVGLTANFKPAYYMDEDFTLMQDVFWKKELPPNTDHVTVFIKDATNPIGWCLEIVAR